MSSKNQTFKDPLLSRITAKLSRSARSTGPGLALFRLLHRGEREFECPVCSYRGPFVTLHAVYGDRKHAECPQCGALERHRLLSLVLDDVAKTYDFSGKAILHFAPEAFFRRRFMALTSDYKTSDLVMRNVDMRADLSNLWMADESVDVLFASYILQYIQDDLRALREIRRVLRPGGFAVLPVTIVSDKTVEYPEPNMAESGGHVRAPGFDYYERFGDVFSRIDLYQSGSYPEGFQTPVYEDRSKWPTVEMPLRRAMSGFRHREVVPVCWR